MAAGRPAADAAEADPVEDPDLGSAARPDRTKRRSTRGQAALIFCTLAALAVAGSVGWLGYRTYTAHQTDHQRQLFLRAARQSALDLTTINYTDVDADVQRILGSSTGTFHDDFAQRSQPFVAEVKREQSKTQGSIIESGVETMTPDSARVVVVIAVTTTTAATPQPHENNFRMLLDVRRVADTLKVSDVQFR